MIHRTPHQIETLRGEPVRVLGRTLTPVARVRSVAQHQGTIRDRSVDGHGWVAVRARPTHVIETRDGHEWVHRIPDRTYAAMLQMVIVSLLVALAAVATIVLARCVWWRQEG